MNINLKENLSKYKSLIGLVILCAIITFVAPTFLTVSNITNVFTQVSVNAIIAVGMTFVILTGGIDLSVGSTLAISGALAASIIKSTGNIYLAIIAACISRYWNRFNKWTFNIKGKITSIYCYTSNNDNI